MVIEFISSLTATQSLIKAGHLIVSVIKKGTLMPCLKTLSRLTADSWPVEIRGSMSSIGQGFRKCPRAKHKINSSSSS